MCVALVGCTCHPTELSSQDLPFRPEQMPSIYTHFRKAVESSARLKTPVSTPALKPGVDDALRDAAFQQLPIMLEEVSWNPLLVWPSLEQSSESKDEIDPRSVLPFTGGETAALLRVQQYIWDKVRLNYFIV
jgi:deoxyribodipyrimidine photo-lyase